MRILVIYCHPVETSYHAALHTDGAYDYGDPND